jgi:hypothetical protein
MLLSWRHSGFNVFCGPRIQPKDQQAMENLARYITRGASACAARPGIFPQERMTYIPEDSKVIYQSKDGKDEKVFDALEWPALLNFPKGTLFNRVNCHVYPCA